MTLFSFERKSLKNWHKFIFNSWPLTGALYLLNLRLRGTHWNFYFLNNTISIEEFLVLSDIKTFWYFKLIPIEILLTNLKKVYNRKSIESENFKRVKRSCKYHALWLNALNVLVSITLYETTFWVLYFQINHFEFNDFLTNFSSVLYFVLHMFYFFSCIWL